jgi:hypothetical protein
MSPFLKLVNGVVLLAEMRMKEKIRGHGYADEEVWGLACIAVREALDTLREIQVSYGRPDHVVCARDNSTLSVSAIGLVHNRGEAKVLVADEHWTDAFAAGLAVNGHTWTWFEMVDGVIDALDACDFAFGEPPVKRKAGERKRSYADEPTAKLLKTAKTLIRVNYGGNDPTEVVRAKLAESGVNAGPVTVAAIVSMLEQMAETCRRAAFPRIDEAIVRLEGTGEVETTP